MSVTLHTSLGDLKLELACELAPRTTHNFLALAASHAYDNTPFHRNIAGFIVQGGDTSGGGGRGGAACHGGRLADEVVDELRHDGRGVVSMANRGAGTAGSQFFITYVSCAHLNSVNSVFGRVIDGMETLDAMERAPVDSKHRPQPPIMLLSCTIHANPIAEQTM